jgi:hypothetical protein
MPLDWIAIAPKVLPFLKKYADELSNKLMSKSADVTLEKTQRLILTDKNIAQANEAFVTRFTKELDSSIDLPTLNAKPYQDALQSFLCNPNVQHAILAPLDEQSKLDALLLDAIWRESRTILGEPLISLPADFNWAKVARTYQQAIERQMLSDPNLRDVIKALAVIRTAEWSEQSADSLKRGVGPVPAFDLARYAKAIRDGYGYLKLGSLDPDWTHYEKRVQLERVYVPQTVKQALPQRDLTRDYLKLPQKEGRLSALDVEKQHIQRRKAEYEQLVPRSLMEVVDDSRQRLLVLLGDPGLGKSTLLKHLTLR